MLRLLPFLRRRPFLAAFLAADVVLASYGPAERPATLKVGGAARAYKCAAGRALTVGPNPTYLTTDLNWNPNVGRIARRVRSAGLGAQWANGAAGVTVQIAGRSRPARRPTATATMCLSSCRKASAW